MIYMLLNLVITLVIVVIFWKDKKKAAFLGCICGFIPGIGLLLSLGYELIEKTIGNQVGEVAFLEIIPDMHHRQVETLDQVERLVAVSEALALNNTKVKKEVLIGVLREDKTKYIETLKVALQDGDVEASHYAAVALMDIKDDLQESIETLGCKLKEAPNDIRLLAEYAKVLEKSISSGLNDVKRLRYLEETYADVLERLIETSKSEAQYYKAKIKCEMRLGHFDKAYTYCTLFKEVYKESEEPYLCLMEYYYLTKNQKGLKAVMEEIKYSSVTLSRTGIQNMRFWLGGMA